MRRGLGWFWRAARALLGGAGSAASYAQSTFTAASATGTADGSTGVVLTLTLRNGAGAVMPEQAVTFVTELTAVDAGQSTLTDDAAEIATTTGVLNLVLHCLAADGTPLPNIQSARIVFASTGSNNTFGTPSVTDQNGRSLCTFSSTTAEAKTISVTVDGVAVTQTCAVTVTGSPSAPTLLVASHWDTATGTTTNAITDGGTFDGGSINVDNASAVETLASLAFTEPAELSTVANAFVNRAGSSNGFSASGQVEVDCGEPGDGDERFVRFYNANFQPDATASGLSEATLLGCVEHGIESSTLGGSRGWNLMRLPRADGTYRPAFRDIYTGYRWTATFTLPKEEFQRFHLHFTYGAATYTVAISIYDADGALVGTEADFTQIAGPDFGDPLTAYAISYLGPRHQHIRMGNNGPSTNYPGTNIGTAPSTGDGMNAMTGFAVSATEDCGIYVDGNG